MAIIGNVLSALFLVGWFLSSCGLMPTPPLEMVASLSFLGIAGAARANARLDSK